MIMNIAWHRKCLKNSTDNAREVESKLIRLKAESERLNENVAFLSLQIQTAVERGLDGFDSEIFMKKSAKIKLTRGGVMMRARDVYVIPELQNAWNRINMIGVCYLDREGVKDRVGKILFLIDDLIGELKNTLEENKI